MTSSDISFGMHILRFLQTQISPELMKIYGNGKQRFYSFMEIYMMQLKYPGVKCLNRNGFKEVYQVFHNAINDFQCIVLCCI